MPPNFLSRRDKLTLARRFNAGYSFPHHESRRDDRNPSYNPPSFNPDIPQPSSPHFPRLEFRPALRDGQAPSTALDRVNPRSGHYHWWLDEGDEMYQSFLQHPDRDEFVATPVQPDLNKVTNEGRSSSSPI